MGWGNLMGQPYGATCPIPLETKRERERETKRERERDTKTKRERQRQRERDERPPSNPRSSLADYITNTSTLHM